MQLRNDDVRQLVRMIGSPYIDRQVGQPVETRQLYDAAYRNRVALLYLRMLDTTGRLDTLRPEYTRQLARFSQLHLDVRRLSPALDALGLRYAFIKTLRFYSENPNDIDVLVLEDFEPTVPALVPALEALGYREHRPANNYYNFGRAGKIGFRDYKRVAAGQAELDPWTWLELDIYGEIMVEELVHGDKMLFAPDVVMQTFVNFSDGTSTRARVLSAPADLFYVLFHSIFPTRGLGLEVFYTTLFDLLHFAEDDYRRFAELARASRLRRELIYCLNLVGELYENAFGTRCERLVRLLDTLQDGRSSCRPVFDGQSLAFPYIFPAPFFVMAGLKSSLHRKGLASMGAVLLKSLYPPYAANIVRETFSRARSRQRHALRYDETPETGALGRTNG